MNFLYLFDDFSKTDIIIFIIVIFIFAFLLFLSISLMKKNKDLRKKLIDINENNNNETNEDIDITPTKIKEQLQEAAEELEKEIVLNDLKPSNKLKQEESIADILEPLPVISENAPYTKNVLKELSREQTSPVNIGKITVDIPKVNVTSYVKKEQSNNEIKEKNKSQTNKDDILEISKKLEEELKSQVIELTDYEKKQEEEAIISYRELIQIKDKLYQISDDEEIMDESQDFRIDLDKGE